MIERAWGHLRHHWAGLLTAFVLVLLPMLAFGKIGSEAATPVRCRTRSRRRSRSPGAGR
jgi:hypothetical protein